MLLSDYKLLTKVLVTRLSRVMDQVQCDETYCVPECAVSDRE